MSSTFFHQGLALWTTILVFILLVDLQLNDVLNWNWFAVFTPVWLLDGVILLSTVSSLSGRLSNAIPVSNDKDYAGEALTIIFLLSKIVTGTVVCLRAEQIRFSNTLHFHRYSASVQTVKQNNVAIFGTGEVGNIGLPTSVDAIALLPPVNGTLKRFPESDRTNRILAPSLVTVDAQHTTSIAKLVCPPMRLLLVAVPLWLTLFIVLMALLRQMFSDRFKETWDICSSNYEPLSAICNGPRTMLWNSDQPLQPRSPLVR